MKSKDKMWKTHIYHLHINKNFSTISENKKATKTGEKKKGVSPELILILSSVGWYVRHTGCPTSNNTASMGLNYDLGDKSENLRRMNHFEKFKANRNFLTKNARFFSV